MPNGKSGPGTFLQVHRGIFDPWTNKNTSSSGQPGKMRKSAAAGQNDSRRALFRRLLVCLLSVFCAFWSASSPRPVENGSNKRKQKLLAALRKCFSSRQTPRLSRSKTPLLEDEAAFCRILWLFLFSSNIQQGTARGKQNSPILSSFYQMRKNLFIFIIFHQIHHKKCQEKSFFLH